MINPFKDKFDMNNLNRLEQELQYQKAVRLTDALEIVSNDEVVLVTANNDYKPIDDPKDLLQAKTEYGLKKVQYIKTNQYGKMFIFITDETVSSQLSKHESVRPNAYNLPTYKQFLNTVPNNHIIFDDEAVVIDTSYKQQKALQKYGDKKILGFEVKNDELVLLLD